MGFSGQEYWSGLPFPSPGDFPNPGIKPTIKPTGDQISYIDRQILWPTTPLRTVLCVCVYIYIHPIGSVSLESPNACSLPLNFTRIYVYYFEICLKESLDSKRSSFLTFSEARIPFPLGNWNPWLSQNSNPLQCLSICCCSVAKLCPTPCDTMNCSMPGFPVLCYLPEFAQTHVRWVGDAIQPPHPLSSRSPLVFSFEKPQVFKCLSQPPIQWRYLWYFLVETFLTWKISSFNQWNTQV